MKNRKPKTENGKPEIGPDRFSFSVSCFPFAVFCFLPVWFRLVRVRKAKEHPSAKMPRRIKTPRSGEWVNGNGASLRPREPWEARSEIGILPWRTLGCAWRLGGSYFRVIGV
jgi:hypothetical protein